MASDMNFLAISGSLRTASTNTAMLRAVRRAVVPFHGVTIFEGLGGLPIFSPDLEQPKPPSPVLVLARAVADADGLIIASPEYGRSIPGGLKNAIDWLVSRSELIGKPIVLAHASHRGDDMLEQLRTVLGTVTERLNRDLFLRLPLMKMSLNEIDEALSQDARRVEIIEFIDAFASYCRSDRDGKGAASKV